jgi:GTP-binding protein HflX
MLFERPEAGSRVLLVHIEGTGKRAESSSSGEFQELARSAGLQAVACLDTVVRRPDPGTFVGRGKVDEVLEAANELDAELVIFDHELTPTQERNLEEALSRRVTGRTGLILFIFSDRAKTHEGKLQVELAQLHHMSTRLVRGWTHLERQRGGSGRAGGSAIGVGGAGETQLEADQRMLANRVKQINRRLSRVRRQRAQNRRARSRSEINTVSLVGYTNAGKSTLFNALVNSSVYAADQLFATLDPTVRRFAVPNYGEIVLSDTVGFIRRLPHTLVDAFRATLEEVTEANLLLHIIDASSDEHRREVEDVQVVLDEIGAEAVPQLLVMNKIDRNGEAPRIDYDASGKPQRVWVSALEGNGLALVGEAIAQRLSRGMVESVLTLAPSQGGLRSALFAVGAVIEECFTEFGDVELQVRCDERRLQQIVKRHGPPKLALPPLPERMIENWQQPRPGAH